MEIYLALTQSSLSIIFVTATVTVIHAGEHETMLRKISIGNVGLLCCIRVTCR